jgi:hypothetical protein
MMTDGLYSNWSPAGKEIPFTGPPMPLVALHMFWLEMAVRLRSGKFLASLLWTKSPGIRVTGFFQGVRNFELQ